MLEFTKLLHKPYPKKANNITTSPNINNLHIELYPKNIDRNNAIINEITSSHSFSTLYESLQNCFFILMSISDDFVKSFHGINNDNDNNIQSSFFNLFMNELFIEAKTEQECFSFINKLLKYNIKSNTENFKLLQNFFFNIYISIYPQNFIFTPFPLLSPLPIIDLHIFLKFYYYLVKSLNLLIFDETNLEFKNVSENIKNPSDIPLYDKFFLNSAFHLSDDGIRHNVKSIRDIKCSITISQQSFAMNFLLIASGQQSNKTNKTNLM
jgi:hypothetical protein